jgi:hypothetical protein
MQKKYNFSTNMPSLMGLIQSRKSRFKTDGKGLQHILALKGRHILAMGAAHRKKFAVHILALKGRHILAMGAAHRNFEKH